MGRKSAADAVVVHGIDSEIADLAVPVDSLVPYPGNARKHATPIIVESLRLNGQYRPIVVQRSSGQVVAGNGTLLAVRELGWSHVAATFTDCDDETARRIVLVDNKANDAAWYDNKALAELLQSVADLAGTGFTQAELDELLAAELPRPALTDPDDVPGVPVKPRSVLGDVWVLGPHRLLCGDSTDVSAVEGMLDGDVCAAMWTDPPYGVSYVGGTVEKLQILNDGADDLDELLSGALGVAQVVLRPGAPFYIAHPAGPLSLKFTDALRDCGWGFRQQLVWVKSSLVLGRSDYHYQHEPILAGVTPGEEPADEAGHENVTYGFTPGGEGRLGRGGAAWFGDNKQTTVFQVPKPPRNADHPTMKPVALITAMLGNSVRPGGLVYEPFGGSGSTLIAAHTLGLSARLVELDPKYCDVICRRYQEHTGVVPVLASTGETVDFTGLLVAS
jgi:site-specific DNA-methyltransferase (adenine-specific)